jgi:hypothetical protein
MTARAAEPGGQVERMVAEFVEAVTRPDLGGDALRRRINDIDGLGAREVAATTSVTERLLEAPAAQDTDIVATVREYRECVERDDDSRRQRRRIQGLLGRLQDARAAVEHRRAARVQDERALRMQVDSLRRYASVAEQIDDALTTRPVPIAVVEAVRHRRLVLSTHLSAIEQAQAALRIMALKDEEILSALALATTTTAAARNTATIVRKLRAAQSDSLSNDAKDVR